MLPEQDQIIFSFTRRVIGNRVDTVKTRRSKSRLPLDSSLVAVLHDWRKITEFKQES